jgi:catechol 2,3-dioxygenase-like lactoylglutathione lyase family enzyme
MIDHLKIEVSDFDASKAFYKAALTALGFRTREFASGPAKHRSLGFSGESLEFYFVEGKATRPAIHVAFRVSDHAKVRAFYDAAIKAGGRSNGVPELYTQYHADYYAAYVFDPDGNNVEAVCHERE